MKQTTTCCAPFIAQSHRAMNGIAVRMCQPPASVCPTAGGLPHRRCLRNNLRVLGPLRVHVEPLVIGIPLSKVLPHVLQQQYLRLEIRFGPCR